MKKNEKKKMIKKVKEFFMPTKGKILTMILLTGVLFVLPYFGEVIGSISFYIILIPLFLTDFFSLKSIGGDIISTPTIFSLIIGLLVYLVEIYLISCIVIGIYLKLHENSRIKNKKKEKKDHFVLIMVVCLISFIVLFSMFYMKVYHRSLLMPFENNYECPPFWHFYNSTNVEINTIEEARELLIDINRIDLSTIN